MSEGTAGVIANVLMAETENVYHYKYETTPEVKVSLKPFYFTIPIRIIFFEFQLVYTREIKL